MYTYISPPHYTIISYKVHLKCKSVYVLITEWYKFLVENYSPQRKSKVFFIPSTVGEYL